MLREQRYQLFSESTFSDNNDIFSESVISNAVDKLRDLIDKIIKKITDFFSRFSKNKKNLEPNPNVEIDEKEVSKLKKFTSAVKRIASMSLKNLSNFVKTHKKTAAFLFLTTVSVGSLVVKANKIKKAHNDSVKAYNDMIRGIDMLEEQSESLKDSLDELNKQTKKFGIKWGKSDKKVDTSHKEATENLKAVNDYSAEFLKASAKVIKENDPDIDQTYGFFISMCKAISGTIDNIQSAIGSIGYKRGLRRAMRGKF